MKFLKVGISTSFQDMGRPGLLSSGLPQGGVLDEVSFVKNNLVLGNNSNENAIELFFPGPEILFEENGVLAVNGADFDAEINGRKLLLGKQYSFSKGEILSFRRKISGNVAYLNFKGGLDLPSFQHSKSYFPSLNFNVIEIRQSYLLKSKVEKIDFIPGIAIEREAKENIFSIVFNKKLKADQKLKFLDNEASILPDSNRMGLKLKFKKPLEFTLEPIISTFVLPGTIQLLPSGEAIILMADAQVTGGYPIIGFLGKADLALLSQKSIGETLSFKEIDIETARKKLFNQRSDIDFIAKNIIIWK